MAGLHGVSASDRTFEEDAQMFFGLFCCVTFGTNENHLGVRVIAYDVHKKPGKPKFLYLQSNSDNLGTRHCLSPSNLGVPPQNSSCHLSNPTLLVSMPTLIFQYSTGKFTSASSPPALPHPRAPRSPFYSSPHLYLPPSHH